MAAAAMVAQSDGLPSHSNIYVRNLPREVDTEALKQMFSSYGLIDNARIVQTGNPVGTNYGFVRFNLIESAQLAVQSMNNAQVGTQVLEVKFAQSDLRDIKGEGNVGTPSDNLYIRNLPGSYGEDDVRSLFGIYGTVKELRMLISGDLTRLNGALVRMGSRDEATNVIEGLNGKPPPAGTQPLLIKYADSDEDKARKRTGNQSLGNPSRYSPYSANRTPMGVQQSGFPGQVAYTVQTPFVGFDQLYQNQGVVTNGSFGMNQSMSGSTSVYVRNIPYETVSESEIFLYRTFAPLGAVTSVFVMSDKETGNSKGIGFVNYTDINVAQMAVQTLNGQKFEDKVLGVALQNSRKR